MLILTRKSNECIVIGDNIEVRILEIRGDQVSLGLSAPRDIPIHRKEVFEAIQHENRLAVSRDKEALDCAVASLGREFSVLAAPNQGKG